MPPQRPAAGPVTVTPRSSASGRQPYWSCVTAFASAGRYVVHWPAAGTFRFFVRATTSESAARTGRCCGAGSEDSTVAQLIEIGEADAGQDIEEVSLGGTDAGRGHIRARA